MLLCISFVVAGYTGGAFTRTVIQHHVSDCSKFFFFFISDTLFLARLEKPSHHNFPQFYVNVKHDFRCEANTATTIGNCFLPCPCVFSN